MIELFRLQSNILQIIRYDKWNASSTKPIDYKKNTQISEYTFFQALNRIYFYP